MHRRPMDRTVTVHTTTRMIHRTTALSIPARTRIAEALTVAIFPAATTDSLRPITWTN